MSSEKLNKNYVPFPVGLLPNTVEEFVGQAATAIGCPPAYVVLPLLSCLASAIGNSRYMAPKDTWFAPCTIWTATIGTSGTTKTPAFRIATSLMKLWEDEAFEAYEKSENQYEKDLVEWKKKKAGPAPVKPVATRYYVDDCTVEALVPLLVNNPRGVMVISSELKAWFASFDKYLAGKGSDAPKWLSIWDGDSLAVDRKTGDKTSQRVTKPVVSVTGTIQPKVLEESVSEDHIENGLLARILLVYPPSNPQAWNDAEIDSVAKAKLHDLFKKLFGLEPYRDTDELGCHELRLSEPAMEIWKKYFNENQKVVAEREDATQYALAKHDQYALRLAMLFHVIEVVESGESNESEVGEAVMRNAIDLIHWFRNETDRVYNIFQRSDEEQEIKDLIFKIVKREGKMKVRDLQRSNSKKYPDRDAASRDLWRLVNAGLGYIDDGTFYISGVAEPEQEYKDPTLDPDYDPSKVNDWF